MNQRASLEQALCDSRAARDSKFVEVLGHYNARTKPETLKLDRERVAHWLKQGAVPSDTIRTMLDRNPAPPAEAVAAPAAQ